MLHSIVHFEHLRDVSEQIYQGGPDKGQAHLVVQAGLDEEGFLFIFYITVEGKNLNAVISKLAS